MDFGGFIVFGFLACICLVCGVFVTALFVRRSPIRWRLLYLWLGSLVILGLSGRYLYQIYWLDERLFIAAAHGDLAKVKALLAAGASPDATWEDGTSAIETARTRGHEEIVRLLTNAGAAH